MENVLTNAKRENRKCSALRNKMTGLTALVICLVTLSGMHPVMAQETPYTIYVGEQLSGKTKITLPFKKGYNLDKFKITAPAGVVISKANGGTDMTVLSQEATGTVPGSDEADGKKGQIIFDLSKDGTLPLDAGEYAFTIEMTSTDGCLSMEVPFNVQVLGKPVLTLNPHDAICSASDANNVNVTGKITPEGGTFKYSWTTAITGTDTENVTGVKDSENESEGGSVVIAQQVSNKTKQPVTITYTVTPIAVYTKNGNEIRVEGDQKSVTITVYPELDLTVPAAQTVCTGTTLDLALTSSLAGVNNTVSWTSSVSGEGATITGNGTSAAVAFPATITDVLANTGTAAGTVTYTVTQSYETCTDVKTIVVTVNPKPTVVLTAPIAVICDGTEGGVTIASDYTGVTFDITVSDNANVTGEANTTVSVTGEWKTGVLTLVPGVTEVQELTYTVTPKIGNCTGEPQTYVLNINPTPTVTLTNELSEICNGTTGHVDISSSVAGVTYVITTTGNTNITVEGSIQAPAGNRWTTPKLTNNTGSFQAMNYKITAKLGECPSVEKSYAVTVVPTITLTQPAAPATICSADAVTTVTFDSPDLDEEVKTEVTYDWSFTYDDSKLGVPADVTISGSGANTKASGSGAFPEINITNKSTVVQTIEVTVTATYKKGVAGLACAQDAPKTFTITVNPKPTFELGE